MLPTATVPGIGSRRKATLVDDRVLDRAAIIALGALLGLNILPFWRRVCSQTPTECYELSIDAAGVPLDPPADRGLILQTRTTFFFSRLAQSRYGQGFDRAIAARVRVPDQAHVG